MASAELTKVLELMGQRPLNPNATLEEMRAGMEAGSFPATEAATVTSVDANGVPGEWVTVPESDSSRRLLYVHGGGYVMGSPGASAAVRGDRAGGRVRGAQSRLPHGSRARIPRGVDDAIAALQFMQENGPDSPGAADSVFVGGTRPAAG